MSLTSDFFRVARLSADVRAVSRGPGAVGKRIVRKAVGRGLARNGHLQVAPVTTALRLVEELPVEPVPTVEEIADAWARYDEAWLEVMRKSYALGRTLREMEA